MEHGPLIDFCLTYFSKADVNNDVAIYQRISDSPSSTYLSHAVQKSDCSVSRKMNPEEMGWGCSSAVDNCGALLKVIVITGWLVVMVECFEK
jgi:hypothetical protein